MNFQVFSSEFIDFMDSPEKDSIFLASLIPAVFAQRCGFITIYCKTEREKSHKDCVQFS